MNRINIEHYAALAITLVGAALALLAWDRLPMSLPCHFNLRGESSATMPRWRLLVLPAASLLINIAAFLLPRLLPEARRKWGLLLSGIASIGLAAILLLSESVTLTRGTMPFFMLAEPFVLIVTAIAFIIFVLKTKRP